MKPQAVRRLVEHALRYLARRLRLARRRGLRWRQHDYADAWELLFEAFYGQDPRPLPQPSFRKATATEEPRPTPRWRVELASCPLRRVVMRLDYLVEVHPRRPRIPAYRELLACGHYGPERLVFKDEKEAQHRRCSECAPTTSSSSYAGARVEAAHG